MADEARKFRHDHKNLLLGFKECIEKKDIDSIQTYFQQYFSEFVKTTAAVDSQFNKLSGIKRQEIKGILSSKLLFAQQLHISVFIDVPSHIEGICDNQLVDICRITGILLDNAIEACWVVDKPVLRFLAMQQKQEILFVFMNTCPMPIPSITQMFWEGFSTKEGQRGAGLFIASQLCNRNKNVTLNTKIKDGNFIQELSIVQG
jgi:two-component system sensor histidine kinase AgrC